MAAVVTEHANLHWLIAAGHDIQIGAGDYSGGAETYLTILADKDAEGEEDLTWWGPLAETLRQAREWSQSLGMMP